MPCGIFESGSVCMFMFACVSDILIVFLLVCANMIRDVLSQ